MCEVHHQKLPNCKTVAQWQLNMAAETLTDAVITLLHNHVNATTVDTRATNLKELSITLYTKIVLY